MRVGVFFVYVDYNRKGAHYRGVLQPQIGPLIAALLPPNVEVEVINDTWEEPDWTRDYDLLFISCAHSDFDRARQISHYWRRRGARTVFGGILASTYYSICQPFFDSIVIGDAEGSVQEIYEDFCRDELKPLYISKPYDAEKVPVPRFDLLASKQVLPLSLEATRGCPFSCEFCSLTGIGTRHHIRSPELVVRDIQAGQEMLKGLVPDWKRYGAAFVDNNIGGNLPHLAKLLEAITPLRLRWGAAITFNAVADPDIVRMLARAGCRFLFMGLESFNPESIADMHKYQNTLDKTRTVLDQCRNHGILILSGLLINPLVDDLRYIESIPSRLRESGLHLPSFLCFECPIPGTPYFHRLAAQEDPGFMPNALLRDFTGYTLVVKPKRESVEDFIAGYRAVLDATFTTAAKLRKLADDLPRFIKGGYWESIIMDLIQQVSVVYRPPHPDRTYMPVTDVVPPEMTSVPLTEDDFDSEEERHSIMQPLEVTDSEGRVLPQWHQSTKVYASKGAISANVRMLGR
jgi:Radical SAM superfamily